MSGNNPLLPVATSLGESSPTGPGTPVSQRSGPTAILKSSRTTGWLAAIAFFLVALIVRLELRVLAPYPFLPFVAAVVGAAFVGGRGPAVAVSVAGAAAAMYFGTHQPPLPGARAIDGIGVTLFALVCALIIALITSLTRLVRRLEEERARSTLALERQRTLFHELQHRVANNMQFVASLLSLQAARVETAEDARSALAEATRRLETLSRIHRRLYDPANAQRDFGKIVSDICHDLLDATGARNVVCRVEMGPVNLATEQLTTLSLIITELLTNSLKHAFADGRGGTVVISLDIVRPGRFALEIRDNGPGFAAGIDPLQMDTLGMRIVKALAQRLGGSFTVSGREGMTARLEFTG